MLPSIPEPTVSSGHDSSNAPAWRGGEGSSGSGSSSLELWERNLQLLHESAAAAASAGLHEASNSGAAAAVTGAATAAANAALSDVDSAAASPSLNGQDQGLVWIALFGLVMSLSLMTNLILTSVILSKRKKRASPIYVVILLMFLFNVIEYALLSFEFSLGIEHHFPYSDGVCTLYQISLRTVPILQGASVVLLLVLTLTSYYRPTSRGGSSSRYDALWAVLFLTVLGCVLSVPTAMFARVMPYEGERFCTVDFRSHNAAVSAYYIIYSAVLSYWVPLLISVPLMLKLLSTGYDSDKHPFISVSLSAASSFFLFYLLHAAVVVTRHSLDAAGYSISSYHAWMLTVIQSLFWLVAYFWHFARPALVILLDPEIKEIVIYKPSAILNSCCRPCFQDFDDEEGQQQQQQQQQRGIAARRNNQLIAAAEAGCKSDLNVRVPLVAAVATAGQKVKAHAREEGDVESEGGSQKAGVTATEAEKLLLL